MSTPSKLLAPSSKIGIPSGKPPITFRLQPPTSVRFVYFPFRGRGEAIRYILHYAKVNFEDTFITLDEWPQKQSSFPFQQLPVLILDGRRLAHAKTICRYLGRLYDLDVTESDWVSAKLDCLVEFFGDFQEDVKPMYAVFAGVSGADREKTIRDIFVPALKRYMPWFEATLKKSKSGWFVSHKLTYFDFVFAAFVDVLITHTPEHLAEWLAIRTHVKKIHGLPELQTYIKNRTMPNY